MLHVILCILKIIGILLLALLLLLLLILLSVLFVPLRYRLQIARIPERQRGEASVTWLLHSVRASFSYDLELRKAETKFFIFGIRIGGKKEKAQEPQPEPEPEAGPETAPEQRQAPEPQQEPKPKQEPGPAPELESGPKPKPEPGPAPEPQQEPEPKPEKKPRPNQEPEPKPGFFENLFYNVRHFCDTIRKIPDRIRRFLSKPQAAWKKLQGYYQIFQDYEVTDTAGEVKDELVKLLHHFRVRKGSGYFRFGTGDPATTAELAGFLYILLPASCGEISVEPQFTDALFQTELTVKGHVRICHLALAFWWGYRNKKLRRIITAFRDR